MSDLKELVVKIRADASGYDKGTKQAQKDNEDLKKSSDGVGGGFLSGAKNLLGFVAAGAGIAGIGMSIGAVKDYLSGAVQGAMDMQVAQAETNRILASGSHVAGLTAASVDNLSQSLMSSTGVDDDVVRGAANILAGYSKISNQAYPDVAKAALDLARAQATATGSAMDANAAAKTLGMAMQDPSRAARLLRADNIVLSQSQQDAIKTALAHGDTMKAQGVILDAVKSKVGGASDAYKNTAAGGMMAFQTAMGNIQKTIGTAILPILTRLLQAVSPIAQQFADKLPGALKAAGDALSHLQPPMKFISDNGDIIKTVLAGLAIGIAAVTIPILVGLIPAFIAWAAAAGAAAIATIIAAAPIIAVIAVITLIVVAIKLLIDHWAQVSAFFQNLGGTVKKAVGDILGHIGEFIGNVIAFFQSLPGKVLAFIINLAVGLGTRFLEMQKDALKKVGDFIGGVIAFFQALPGRVWNFVTSLATGIMVRIADLELSALHKVGDLIGGIIAFFQSIPGKVGSALDNLKNLAISKINDLKDMFKRGLDNILGFFTNLHLSLPHINLPHFSISGSFSISPPSVPHLDIKWYAGGGVFTAPSVIGVGEAGPEAVIPLNRLSSVGGGSGSGGNGGSGSSTVILQVDGRELARALLPHTVAEIQRKTGLKL